MQEVWLNVWRSFDAVRDERSAKAWIAVLSRNAAKNILDKKTVKDKNMIAADEDVFAAAPDGGEDPVDLVASRENIEYIYRQMRDLDEKYAAVLLLKYKFNRTPAEIADILHIRLKTVYTRLCRGKELLKNKLLQSERGEEIE